MVCYQQATAPLSNYWPTRSDNLLRALSAINMLQVTIWYWSSNICMILQLFCCVGFYHPIETLWCWIRSVNTEECAKLEAAIWECDILHQIICNKVDALSIIQSNTLNEHTEVRNSIIPRFSANKQRCKPMNINRKKALKKLLIKYRKGIKG